MLNKNWVLLVWFRDEEAGRDGISAMHLLQLEVWPSSKKFWAHIWKFTMEKSQTNATNVKAFYKNLPNYQWLLMYQQKLTQLPMVDVPTVSKWAVHLLPGFDAFYKVTQLSKYLSKWAIQCNARGLTHFFLSRFLQTHPTTQPSLFCCKRIFSNFQFTLRLKISRVPGTVLIWRNYPICSLIQTNCPVDKFYWSSEFRKFSNERTRQTSKSKLCKIRFNPKFSINVSF